MPNSISELNDATSRSRDEFYTLYHNVEAELSLYGELGLFKGKTVLCPCDDPYKSSFTRWFLEYGRDVGLYELRSTSWSDPQLELFDTGDGWAPGHVMTWRVGESPRYASAIGSGCMFTESYWRGVDMIVTNPPFSKLAEFFTKCMSHRESTGADFLLLGTINVAAYSMVFDRIKFRDVRLGHSMSKGGDMHFEVPASYLENMKYEKAGYVKDGRSYIRVKGIRWYTTMDHGVEIPPLDLTERFDEDAYPVYDNCLGREVSRVSGIPYDYTGYMGVPITFLDKWNPEQFEIVELMKGHERMRPFIKNGWSGRSDVCVLRGENKFARLLITPVLG